jgi:Tfp pilus assembly protein PilO
MNNQNNKVPQKTLADRFKDKKIQDFSYAILFLLVSSFFAYFVIRPVLTIAVALHKEGIDLKRINTVYESNITKVLELQAELEDIRPKTYLLDAALPTNPKLEALITDMRKVAEAENIQLSAVSVEGLQLKKGDKMKVSEKLGQAYSVKLDVSIVGSYEEAVNFIKTLSQQRRIKTIQSVEITSNQDPKATSSALPGLVKLRLSVQAYYL